MSKKRPNTLTIAGLDPSGGAGLLADIKTLEANQVNGSGVCTAITYQHDRAFDDVSWISEGNIEQQIRILSDRYHFTWAKIGLIQNFNVLDKIINFLGELYPGINIIWDPILKSSTGFTFHENISRSQIEMLADKIYLMTPNKSEIEKFMPGMPAIEAADILSERCAVLITSAKHDTHVTDILVQNGEHESFSSRYIHGRAKHGSGCVLSSAILANLAKGDSLENSCGRSKEYLQKFLLSSEDLVGKHLLN